MYIDTFVIIDRLIIQKLKEPDFGTIKNSGFGTSPTASKSNSRKRIIRSKKRAINRGNPSPQE